MLRKYPIGLQSFRKIREGGYVYIDKTEDVHQLIETGKYYFLSRPRRFGKSLLVDTIEELFNGSKELFNGLWIHDKWDWTKNNPVIRISFTMLPYKEVGLSEAIKRTIVKNADRLGISLTQKVFDLQFQELIEKASVNGRVVILIDEYDKPIVDFLEEPEVMKVNRSIMQSFYSILKDSDKYIRFILVTGVSQFSPVNIFSDLNNLRNITLLPQFGSLVGITQRELEDNFAPEIREMQKDRPDILTQLKDWYNGYTWDMKTWVYNPFSLMNFMAGGEMHNYWFESGTTSFLVKQLKKHKVLDVENRRLGATELATFDANNPDMSSLLFQTGYLTVKNISPSGQVYTLGFPNQEVKDSFLDGLLKIYVSGGVAPGGSVEVV